MYLLKVGRSAETTARVSATSSPDLSLQVPVMPPMSWKFMLRMIQTLMVWADSGAKSRCAFQQTSEKTRMPPWIFHYQEHDIYDHHTLSTNYEIQKKRTQSTIHRLSKEPHLLKKYGDLIRKQERRGFIKNVVDPVTSNRVHGYTIFHTMDLRRILQPPHKIVYDCSCHASGSPGLNDCLDSTSLELDNLTTLFMTFRQWNGIFEPCPSQKRQSSDPIFVVSDPADPKSRPVTCRFQSVLFGATCLS